MSTLAESTGQKGAIEAVLAQFDRQGRRVVLIRGVRASGVSWTVDEACRQWKQAGGAALQGRGERFANTRPLFPWLSLAMPASRRLARADFVKRVAAAAGQAVPVASGVSSRLVKEITTSRKRRRSREALLLSGREQEILFMAQSLASDQRLLLAFDHLDEWDDESLGLLALLLHRRIDAFYPALANAVLVLGEPSRPEVRELLNGIDFEVVELHLINEKQMAHALGSLGLTRGMAEDQMATLFEITNGRLDLLHDIVIHLTDRSTSLSSDDLLGDLISRRLSELDGAEPPIGEVLVAAAVLGHLFAARDLRCMVDRPKEAVEQLLQRARAQRLIVGEDPEYSFFGPATYSHFLHRSPEKQLKYHLKFAECLRMMRPSEYLYRTEHARVGGDREQALTCWVLAVLASWRDRTPEPDPGELRSYPEWDTFAEYHRVMREAYSASSANDLPKLRSLVSQIDDYLPTVLLAERDYLLARLLLRSHRVSDFEEAASLLRSWDGLKSVEGEVWSRMAQTLLVAEVQIGQWEKARATERSLSKYYWSRRELDPWALHGLNALRRRSEGLHELAAARVRLLNAASFFGPQEGGETPRNLIEYYYALNNLVANLTASGIFDEAATFGVRLKKLITEFGSVSWPIVEVPISNLTLVGFLTRRISAKEASELISPLLDGTLVSGDRLLFQSNLAALLAHSGKLAKASSVIESAMTGFDGAAEVDPYHRYFVQNNLAGIRLVMGRTEEAGDLFEEIRDLPAEMQPAVRHVLKVRHKLLEPLMRSRNQSTVASFEDYLRSRHSSQVGPEWAFFGRGFLLSDIQYWTGD